MTTADLNPFRTIGRSSERYDEAVLGCRGGGPATGEEGKLSSEMAVVFPETDRSQMQVLQALLTEIERRAKQ